MIDDRAQIDRLARASVAASYKVGEEANSCRYRFKSLRLTDEEEFDGRRREFAHAVAAYSAVELGSRAAPEIRWFIHAGMGEKADLGSDNWNGHGIMMAGKSDPMEIWVSDETPNSKLVYVVAHETLHAVKHRGLPCSLETEQEAVGFGLTVAAAWDVGEAPGAELIVVEAEEELPYRIQPGSTALSLSDMTLYRASHKGTLRSPLWVVHRKFDGQPGARSQRPPGHRVIVSQVDGGRWLGSSEESL